MLKSVMLVAVVSSLSAPVAFAGPAERLGRLDHRLDRLEANGTIAQGSRADRIEDRFDRYEDRLDRRESRRDEAIDFGPRDVREDRRDRRESVRDRRENRRDRAAG